MKRLIYVPIIHMSADLGSIAEHVDGRGIADFGKDFWRKHRETVSNFWDSIVNYFANLDVKGFRIYQDGMVADEEVGRKIVEEGVSSGSKNYELISDLLKRGALLVRTEDFRLVKEERDRLLAITQAKSIAQKLIAFAKYRLVRNKNLRKRDKFIAERIDETLNEGETGIILVGAYHDIKNRLPKDIQIIEIKDARKVREYQRLLPFHNRNKERFEALGRYLVSPIPGEPTSTSQAHVH